MEQETFVLFHVAGVTAKNEPVWSLALVYIKRRQVLSHGIFALSQCCEFKYEIVRHVIDCKLVSLFVKYTSSFANNNNNDNDNDDNDNNNNDNNNNNNSNNNDNDNDDDDDDDKDNDEDAHSTHIILAGKEINK
ncbi:hypothetical protein V1478_012011 [Vespula squamosa]|uniref:Uncharacterized protein n=1 Tax=Vespula squamosa TaxID=30214 RepID=A0ABD2AE81_VESSQ